MRIFKRNKPGEGKVIIRDNSSLRKLMRAARRGKMPDNRQAIIDIANRNAAKRQRVYRNRHAI